MSEGLAAADRAEARPRSAGASAAVPDRRPQPGVGTGLEAVQASQRRGVETIVESFDRSQIHGRAALRVVGEQRHPITEFV